MKRFIGNFITGLIVAGGIVYLTEARIIPWQKIIKKQYRIPDFTGLSLSDAEVLARAKNLKIEIIREEFSDKVEDSLVVMQKPGESAVTGSNVVGLVVSKGKPKVYIPDVSGMDIDKAINRLRQDSINKVKKTFIYSDKGKDKVIKTEPKAGTGIDFEKEVEIIVSKGRKLTTVPNLSGNSLSEAKNKLINSNLELGYIKKETDIEQRFGVILRQHPPAGKKVEEGTSVTIVLNEEDR